MAKKREKKLDHYFENLDLDAILITDLINIRYLTGFTGSSATVLLINKKKTKHLKSFFLTDGRYDLKSKQEVSNYEIIITNSPIEELIVICNKEKLARIGFESMHLTFNIYEKLFKNLNSPPIPIKNNLNKIRFAKDPTEIDEIKKSIDIATKSFFEIKPMIKTGISEKELKYYLENAMLKNGARKPSFESIVAFEKNSALPHATPTDYKLKKEMLVLIDFGSFANYYASDETITLYFGSNPSEQIKQMYDTVKKAHDEAISKIKPGMRSSDVDLLARNIITQAGYGKNFNHSLGHSIGLETHDGFRLSAQSEEVIEEGMVLTIEPGIYIEHLGGIRLEDMVLVTKKGAEVLTRLPKTLFENMIS